MTVLETFAEKSPLSVPEGSDVLLRDLVHERAGIWFDTSRVGNLLEKLGPLALDRGCRSFLDYYYLLKFDDPATEWQRVMDVLSVQETYFWREIDQVHALVNVIVPAWFKKKSAPLRIWSAACASGEEPFTLAIALNEAGWFDRAPIEITASDASVAALDNARRGTYRERSFRTLPAHLRAKYFQPVGRGWCIVPEILVRVRFQRANLVATQEIDHLARSPVIFCRNVFIYFSAAAITRTVNQFADRMPVGGHLFVGVSESLLRLTNRFELEEVGDAFAYVNKPRSSLPSELKT